MKNYIKIKKYIIIILFFLTLSCSERENIIYYTYNNTTVTRIDKGNEIYFYYGRLENIKLLPKPYIRATYSGFDDYIDAYLIFDKNKNVKIIRLNGLFDEINIEDNILKLEKFEHNIDLINWTENINYKNVCRLSNTVEIEIKRNKKNNSEVNAYYTYK
jgi:hypothetical protein